MLSLLVELPPPRQHQPARALSKGSVVRADDGAEDARAGVHLALLCAAVLPGRDLKSIVGEAGLARVRNAVAFEFQALREQLHGINAAVMVHASLSALWELIDSPDTTARMKKLALRELPYLKFVVKSERGAL